MLAASHGMQLYRMVGAALGQERVREGDVVGGAGGWSLTLRRRGPVWQGWLWLLRR